MQQTPLDKVKNSKGVERAVVERAVEQEQVLVRRWVWLDVVFNSSFLESSATEEGGKERRSRK